MTAAVAYAVLHHLGLLPSGLGEGPSGTRWADWLDLAVPWLVIGPAAATVWAAGAPKRTWVILGAGAISYTSGHRIHLAANSVSNRTPGQPAHLWDEVVGHHIWYAGVALLLWALASTMAGRPRPPLAAHILAVAVGLTWASNAVGGGTVVLSLAVALVASAFGLRSRHGLGVVLLTGFLPAAIILVGVVVRSLLG